jgi:hypothetical protein
MPIQQRLDLEGVSAMGAFPLVSVADAALPAGGGRAAER